ncbi:MAG: calcium/sodium antiporter [Candidatus Aminicenantales bacterium]
MVFIYFLVLLFAFALLFKCAGWFIRGASTFATVLSIPKLIVGIVVVGLATTAPEFGVSVQAAYLGHPEIALGNAIGSVICDDGIALALAALFAPTVIFVNCRILRIAAAFLLSIDLLAYGLALNGTLGRAEGVLFIFLLCLYFIFVIRFQSGLKFKLPEDLEEEERKAKAREKWSRLRRPLILFLGGITGVIITSRLVIWSAVNIARTFGISETVIGLTVVAIGTSLPEISTCITAALRGEGEIAVGNIIGADVLNILWIIGVSAVVNPIEVELDVINFTFPYMIFIVLVMLVSMRLGCRMGKVKGAVLFILYLIYLFLTLHFFW